MSAATTHIANASTVHTLLVSTLTAGGGTSGGATFSAAGPDITCAILGGTYAVRPAGIVVAARGAATIYSMTFGPAGTPDAFALGNDGAIYAGRDAFQTGGVALATLGSGDPRAALVTHLGTALGARGRGVKFYVVLVADGGRWEFNSRHDCREDAAEVAREFMAMGQAARVVERWDGD